MRPRKAGSQLRCQYVYTRLLEGVVVCSADLLDLHPSGSQLSPAKVGIVCPEEPHAAYAEQGHLARVRLRVIALQSLKVRKNQLAEFLRGAICSTHRVQCRGLGLE